MNQLFQDIDPNQYNYPAASISQAISTTLWVLLLFIPLIQVSVCIICMYIIMVLLYYHVFAVPITVDEGFVEWLQI